MMNRPPHALNPAFSSTEFQENLYRHYQDYLRNTPVFRSDEGVVYLTRYQDCLDLLGNAGFRRSPPSHVSGPFSVSSHEPTPLETMVSHWMLFMDPPRHDAVRKAFMQPFSAKAMQRLEPCIRRQANQLLDALPQQGTVDILQGYAYPLPVMVIADLLGVPQQDIGMFYTWSAQLTQALDTGREEDLRRGTTVALTFKNYFAELLKNRHGLPADSLIPSMADDRGSALSADELLYGFIFLLWAGHETTKNLIANGIQILADRPEQLSRLRRQPELIESAVEEMLRFDSPVQKLSRWTHQPAEFGVYTVPAGTLVTALLGAANRDHAVFSDPDMFDIARSRNRHIAFGTGIHHCLGALLARLEGRIAFGELLPRLQQLEPDQHQWRTFSAFRSLESLSVKVSLAC